jgi:hypothetical protein
MDTTNSLWSLAQVCMLIVYVCTVIGAIVHLCRHRRNCLTCTHWQAWLRSGLLAFLVTPSLIGDFWLFMIPGPAALGFAVMLPGVVFATGHRL